MDILDMERTTNSRVPTGPASDDANIMLLNNENSPETDYDAVNQAAADLLSLQSDMVESIFYTSTFCRQFEWYRVYILVFIKLNCSHTRPVAINNQAPKYIQKLIIVRQQQNHNLRSNNKVMLESPSPLNKNKHEERAFSFAAPILWNPLPEYVKNAATLSNFKKNLKTHLFQNCYKN